MNWQIKYALENFLKSGGLSTAEYVSGDVIKILTRGRPDALAVVSAAHTIDVAMAAQYKKDVPGIDFLCGYRTTCVWEGDAIKYLEENGIGWGSFGTLCSAVLEGNANTASHKVFSFSDRLIRQSGFVKRVERKFDRVYDVTLKNGRSLRLGLVAEYEPTADAVRSLWDRFGPVDIVWNINPNGNPTQSAIEAGHELGCEVLNWEGVKEYMKKAR